MRRCLVDQPKRFDTRFFVARAPSRQEALHDGFEAVVKQKVGPVKATFKGGVTLTDVNAPDSYRIVGEGKGGVAGFAKGSADVTLTEVEGGTELTYHVDAQVGGKLAQLGNRIVGGFAKKMADAFFENFQSRVEDSNVDAS